MKSSAINLKGSVYFSEVIGKRGGLGFVGLFFRDWQVAHPLMYPVIVSFIFGHQ